jgi:KAP family P-loop domain
MSLVPRSKQEAIPAVGPSDSIFDAPALTELTDDADAFGHHDYAAALAEVLVEAGTPFTLGLYGPWGVGKTLILTEARKIIGQRCAYVIFDAWRYDGDALRRHFLRDIARQLDEGEELEDWYNRDDELKDLDVARSEPTTGKIEFSGKQLLSGGIGLAIIGLLALFLWIAGDFHKALTGLVAGAGVVALAIAVLSPFANAIELTEVTEIRERLVDAELFTIKFEDLLAAVKKSRLVVAIDNLDRCSPTRVTELLETLNTYLEPASVAGGEQSERLRRRREGGKKPDAVFAVAADDVALKRHIESREARASEGATENFREDVGRYADEYLRKIFTATIPIKPALAPDLRAYIDKRLERLVAKRSISDEDRNRLVEVITEGLRRNPRRVSQFIRNLELRLRLLDERHEAEPPRIAERLTASQYIPFVAKLLVLEEEWPTAYRELERDQTRLATWHEQQQTEAVDVPEFAGSPLKGETPDSQLAFVGFLATTRTITSTRLAAFLSLKQSQIEVTLPRYADFATALTSGQPELLREVTESAGEQLQAYANEVKPLANAQLPRYWATARVVVETALADPVLGEKAQPTMADLVKWAYDRGDQMRKELREAKAETVLGASAWLSSDTDFNRVMKLFLVRDETHEVPVACVVGLPTARVNDENRDLIRQAINAESLAAAPNSVLALLRWDARVATSEAATAALSRFIAEPPKDGPDAEIVEISLRSVWREQASGNEVLQAVDTILAAAYEPSPAAERATIVDRLVALVRQIADNDEAVPTDPAPARLTAVQTASQQISDSVLPRITEADELAPLLDLVGHLARLSGADGAVPVLPAVERMRVQLPDALIAYAEQRGKNLVPTLMPGVTQALGVLVDSQRDDAAQALTTIDSTDSQGQLAAAAGRAIGGKLYPFVESLLGKHQAQLSAHIQAFANAALADGISDPAGLDFALAHASALAPEELGTLESNLIELIAANAEAQSYNDLLARIEAAPAFDADRFARILWGLWDRARVSPAPPIGLLQLLLPRFDKLDAARQNTLPEIVKAWLESAPIGPLLQVLEASAYKGKPRSELVGVLKEREPLVAATEHQQRAALLSCARSVAEGAPNSVTSVQQRIADLEKGTPDDQAVFALLQSPAPPPDTA